MSPQTVSPGLADICARPPAGWGAARLGLLCNQASVLPDLTPAPEALAAALPGRLTALFSPQHGLYGDKQDNMVESGHGVHPRLGLPLWSLYGDTRRPNPEMFRGIDRLLIDLPDVGCRVYTFFTTALYCLEEAARQGVAVSVLDRPNPLGRGEEGPILPPELMSFVGPLAMPLRHGLSLGELCRLAAAELGLDLDLEVIPAAGWSGGQGPFPGMPWVPPSPNLPCFESLMVYPGQVLLEGTTLSEGRGTTRPFETWGAPGLDPWAVAEAVEPECLAGARLRPLFFEPTFHKHAGQTCGGFMIHVTQPELLRPVRLSLGLLAAVARVHPGLWGLRPPPYEYEYEREPLHLLLGDAEAVAELVSGGPALAMEEGWQAGLAAWRRRVAPHLIYP